MLDQQAHW